MGKVVIENPGPDLMFVGSHIVPAGEARIFEEGDLPASLMSARSAPAEPQAAEPVQSDPQAAGPAAAEPKKKRGA